MKVKTVICYPQSLDNELNKIGYENVKQIIPFYEYRYQQQVAEMLIIYEVKDKKENTDETGN